MPAAKATQTGEVAPGPEGAVKILRQLIAPGGATARADDSEAPPRAPDPVRVLRGLFGIK